MRAVTTRVLSEIRDRPELNKALRNAVAAFDAMTPQQKRDHREAQRRSWVVAETMMAHPEMTREQAEAIYDEVR